MANVIPCPNRDDLQRFLLGQLPETDAERLNRHLADCPLCLDTLHGLEAKDTLIDAMRAQKKPAERSEDAVVEDLMAHLSDLQSPVAASAAETTIEKLPATRKVQPEDCSFLAPAEAPDELGRLGGYRVLKILGGGDMGIVLEAEDPRLKRRVALKVMKPSLATNDVARKRFLREAQAVAALEHDHIVAIHEVDEDRGVPFLAMPLLRGETLEDRLGRQESGVRNQESERGRGLPLAETLRIGREIAEGLAAAHAVGLTHRDVKPANVWLEQAQGRPSLGFGRVKIVDFGLARPAEDDLHLTASGTIAGTPSYMAPEQAEGKTVDFRCDLFSLGAVLYRMATGKLPFPGTSAISVLRAVATEQPAPPRTLNLELPPELSDLVMRLLSKQPEKRPASARAVAEALAKLEHAQAAKTAAVRPAAKRRRVPLLAAAALFALAVGTLAYIGPAATYRFVTNQGTLTITTHDEDVEITVKQKGEQVEILNKTTGQQISLKAGPYELEIQGREGLTLTTNQFTLTRGEDRIVEVRFDPALVQAKPPEKVEQPPKAVPKPPPPTPFVILARGGKTETKHVGLAEAVAATKSGDIVEIRGNGPFETPTIYTGNRSLVLRAGKGFEPVLMIDATSLAANAPLLYSNGPLVLEGLHFRHVEETRREGGWTLIQTWGAPFSASHCRFFLKGRRHLNALSLGRAPRAEVRHCEFAGDFMIAINLANLASFHRFEITDCLNWGAGHFIVYYHFPPDIPHDISLALHRNTSLGYSAVQHYYGKLEPAVDPDKRPFHIDARDNVFDTGIALSMTLGGPGPFQPDVDKPLVPRCLAWNESKNVYTGNLLHFTHNPPQKYVTMPSIKQQLNEWRDYWGVADTGSKHGRLRYEGENVRVRKASAADKLTAADFRLHRDSDGKGAGAGGRDLGVDVDKIGPGTAYHEWQKSSAYPRWRDATGQVLDPEPIVLLDPNRKKEFRYDTLAKAVADAQAGDVIEIRGNGPFVTPSLKLRCALVIRAGAGFEPVLQLDAKSLDGSGPLMGTHSALTLEGLHFRHVEEAAMKQPDFTLIHSNNSPLAVAHCRFFVKSKRNFNTLLAAQGQRVHVSHCEFAGACNNAVVWNLPSAGELEATDNLCWGTNSLVYFAQHPPVEPRAIALRLRRNTFLGHAAVLQHCRELPEPSVDQAQKPYRIDAVENVFDANPFIFVFTGTGAFDPESLRPLLPRVVAWNEGKNLYRESGLLTLGQHGAKFLEAVKSRDEWLSYWSLKDTGSVHQAPRYQGSDVRATKISAPEKLSAGDFRLHPESPGKGTGANGRDLGAAVELVGPGAAYEYWKRTPQYQDWLKATGR